MKANQKKTLPDEEKPLQTPAVPPAPTPAPAVYTKPADDIEPADDIQTTAGMPFAQTFPVSPEESYTDGSAAGAMENPADISLPFPEVQPPGVYNTDAAPVSIQNPDPATYWTPPCMQANYNFPPNFPVQEYTFTEQNPPDVFVNTPLQPEVPAVWPYSAEATAAQPEASLQVYTDTNAESAKDEEAVVTLSQLWPSPQDLPNIGDEAEEPAADETAAETCEVPPCPSLYWPQAPDTEAEEIMNRQPPFKAAVPEQQPESGFSPPPSVIRPAPRPLPPEEELEIGRSMPPEAARPQPESMAAPDMGSALLQIHASTGKKAKPVPGARIIIFRPDGDREILLKIVTTDKDGHTPPLSLPAAEANYSLHSGAPNPSLFTIETSAPKYCHTRHINVPLYGGVASVLEVELTPLPEDEDGGREMVYDHMIPGDK